MKINFRQGIISSQVDGTGQPFYLVASATPNFVDLNVSPTPCAVTFVHGSSDYLQVFSSAVAPAWGPVPTGTSYLYWDIDLLTAVVSYGLTTLEPVASTVEPVSPPAPLGQAVYHWFDMNVNTMKIWTGTKWRAVVRVFAGRVNGSTVSITMEPLGQSWKGILPVQTNTGFIATDIFSNPLRTLAGEFVTTETAVRFRNTVGTSGVLAVLPNAFVPVRAGENIPAMSLVHFRDDGNVGLASGNPALMPTRVPVGVMQQALGLNEVGSLTQNGEITYDQWDWSAHVGRPVYCGENGEIVTTRPPGLMAYRVGVVKAAKTILFLVDAETMPQVYQAAPSQLIIAGTSPVTSSSAVNGLGEIVWTIGMPAASLGNSGYMTLSQATTLESNTIRITAAELALAGKANLIHGHAIADVTGLQLELDGKAPLVHNHDTMYSQLGHNHDGYHALVMHSHVIPDVLGLQAALDGKTDLGHLHPITDVTGLQVALDDKMDRVPGAVAGNIATFAGNNVGDSGVAITNVSLVGHGHVIGDVAGLQVAIDGKADLIHTHAISDIIPLQNELDNRSLVGHVHVASNITDFSEAVDDRVADLLVAGTNITLNYDDVANTLTINASGGTVVNRPQHQLLLGIGTNGVNSSPNAVFNATTGLFNINATATPLNTAGSVFISTAFNNAGWGNAFIQMLPNDLKGGSIFLNGGGSDTDEDGGDILLNGGASNAQGTGGGVYLTGGTSEDARGGDVVISGGSPSAIALLGAGGDVIIAGGVAVANVADNGSIVLRTGTVNRLRVARTGEWELGAGADAGTSGYVLTSNGVGSPVTWEPAGAGPTAPGTSNQVLASDGAGTPVAREVEITSAGAVGIQRSAVTALYLFNEPQNFGKTSDQISGKQLPEDINTPLGTAPAPNSFQSAVFLTSASSLNGNALGIEGSTEIDLVPIATTSLNWTVELGTRWPVPVVSTTSTLIVLTLNSGGTNEVQMRFVGPGPTYSAVFEIGNGPTATITVPGIASTAWVRWAIVITGATVTVYANGVQAGSGAFPVPPGAPYGMFTRLGRGSSTNDNFDEPAFIDELRIAADALYAAPYTPSLSEPSLAAGSLGTDFGTGNQVLTSSGPTSQAYWAALPPAPPKKYVFRLQNAGATPTFNGTMRSNYNSLLSTTGERFDGHPADPLAPSFSSTTDLFTFPVAGMYEVLVTMNYITGGWPNGLSSFGIELPIASTYGGVAKHCTRFSDPAAGPNNSADLAGAVSPEAGDAANQTALTHVFYVQVLTPGATSALRHYAFNSANQGVGYSVNGIVAIQRISDANAS